MPFTIQTAVQKFRANMVCTDLETGERAIDADLAGRAAYVHTCGNYDFDMTMATHCASLHGLYKATGLITERGGDMIRFLDALLPLNEAAISELAHYYASSIRRENKYRDMTIADITEAMRQRRHDMLARSVVDVPVGPAHLDEVVRAARKRHADDWAARRAGEPSDFERRRAAVAAEAERLKRTWGRRQAVE